MTEERERILNEARKLVLGADGNPATNQAQIDASFPLTRPQWNFNTAEEGARGHLAAPPCHLRGWPDPDTSSVQAGRLGLRQEAPLRDPRAALEGTLHRGADNPHRSQSRRHRDLGPSHPRSASGPLHDPEGLRHTMGCQSGPTQPAQAQVTAHSTHLILVILLALLVTSHAAESPHAPQNITWQIIDTSSGTILNQTSQSHPTDTWFPELCVDLQTLLPLSPYAPGFHAQNLYFYVCPGHSRSSTCGDAADYFCASWSCVSTGHIWWTPPRTGDLIVVKRPSGSRPPYAWGRGNPIVISFTSQGKKTTGWESGKTWGLRIYDWVRLGAKDKGTLFTLRMQATPLAQQSPTGVGPNQVLVPRPAPTRTATPRNT
ncbi:protein chibby homolog 3 isoform X2 [Leopardus geoffroyi]|nr:protein chibby homolog 3 isoform X2 [Leopardus geoffroyi]XP_045340794.1 protein chibby homolog 3 isoform X2 [Leopardus geoffroyi]XP_045340802.1 protein chibby homolog 3 isoform X2 [Leopardus geoffroyi]XP_045340811.1 protein chibby homolog 3 isoform X2 [Leopardus geoffroyi]XP_045340819.1 protein chibby homolog 3 isoform X2 [Leopardus geoffroyi]XP_045340829.1 protein chibby homolog 3 isoform X2 [Leopardus geoffroyi]XP_045340833.1 protein chibby homolog 3 isoform X2 [Leopardus geoffroyi]XP_0